MSATYRLRSEGRELELGSLDEIRRANEVGLVDPIDEVRFPGTDVWRRVEELPVLRRSGFRWLRRWWRPVLEAMAAVLGPRIWALVRQSEREWKGEGWSPPRKGP
jgi:hypothetical protein